MRVGFLLSVRLGSLARLGRNVLVESELAFFGDVEGGVVVSIVGDCEELIVWTYTQVAGGVTCGGDCSHMHEVDEAVRFDHLKGLYSLGALVCSEEEVLVVAQLDP
jgi:hypothetical protein